MKFLIGFVIVCVLTFVVGTCSIQTIEPGNVGVKLRLSKVQNEVVGEGLQFKNPITEEYREVNIRQFTAKGHAECPSSDSQLVNINFTVMARIDPSHAPEVANKYANNGVEDLYKSLVEPVALDGIKPIVVKYRAEEALSKRDEIRGDLLTRLKKEVNHLFIIEDLRISDISLSAQLREAIEAKQVKEQEAISVKYDLEKARLQAEVTLANAKAEAEAINLKGKSLRENPNVIQLEILKKWNGVSPQTIVLGQDGDSATGFVLPLKPIEKQ